MQARIVAGSSTFVRHAQREFEPGNELTWFQQRLSIFRSCAVLDAAALFANPNETNALQSSGFGALVAQMVLVNEHPNQADIRYD